MLEGTARRLPGFDKRCQRLPIYRVMLHGHAACTDIGARHGIITVCTKDFTEALAIFEFARHT